MLQEVQSDGATLRHHLESLEQQTGITPEHLESVEMPAPLEYLWWDFLELNSARTSNGYTLNPISYQELEAWMRLTNKKLNSNEVSILKLLDGVFMKHYQQKQQTKGD